MNRLFTSESVTEGHPDKVCDTIADAVLDAVLTKNPLAHSACEVCATTDFVLLMGEVSGATLSYDEIESLVTRLEKSDIQRKLKVFAIKPFLLQT